MSADHATAPAPTRANDPLDLDGSPDPVADAFDRADAYHAEIASDDVDELRRELADTQAALDVATAALLRERPTPHPRALGHAMKVAYFRNPGAQLASHDDRWTWAAETAIDIITGLLQPTTTAAEGGEDVPTGRSPAGPAPVLGGTHPARGGDVDVEDLARAMWTREAFVRHTAWEVLRPSIRQFYLVRAAAVIDHLTARGWQPPRLPAAAVTANAGGSL